MTETNTPDDVYMKIITDNEMFSLNLTRYRRYRHRIPLFIDGGSTLERRDMEMLKVGLYTFILVQHLDKFHLKRLFSNITISINLSFVWLYTVYDLSSKLINKSCIVLYKMT